MSQDTFSTSSRTPRKSYRQIQQEKKTMKKSFAVADKIAPKIRAHEQKEAQEADAQMDQLLQMTV